MYAIQRPKNIWYHAWISRTKQLKYIQVVSENLEYSYFLFPSRKTLSVESVEIAASELNFITKKNHGSSWSEHKNNLVKILESWKIIVGLGYLYIAGVTSRMFSNFGVSFWFLSETVSLKHLRCFAQPPCCHINTY